MNGWISSALPFVAVGALVLCIWLFMLAGSRAAAEVPKQQKNEYQDDPPRYWALLGWLGHATTFWVTPLVSPTMRRRLHEQLRRGGLEFALTPEQFVAGQVLGALLALALLVLAWLPHGLPSLPWCVLALVVGAFLPMSWLRDLGARRTRQIAKALPFYLDIITRAIGVGAAVEMDLFELPLEGLSMLLLCTDGLTNMLGDDEIGAILRGDETLSSMAEHLIQAANEKGGRDNTSVVLVDLREGAQEE